MKPAHPDSTPDPDLTPAIGFVHGLCPTDRCEACGSPPARHLFRVVLDPQTVDLALDRAARGENVLIRDLKWICSRCAAAQSTCPRCGAPQAGMDGKFRWFCDDDGLVTCNPYVLTLREKPQSCTSPGCENYSFEDCVRAAECWSNARRRGFSDPMRA